MIIYELEDRIYFDGAIAADAAEVEDTSTQDAEDLNQTEDNAEQSSENVSIAPDDTDSSENSDTSSDSESDSGTEPGADDVDISATDSSDIDIALEGIDNIELPDGFEPDRNVIIVSTEADDYEDIINSANDNTIIIEYSSDDTLDSILQSLKDALGEKQAVNIAIMETDSEDTDSTLTSADLAAEDFLNELSELQTVDGEVNFIDLDSEDTDVSEDTLAEYFDLSSSVFDEQAADEPTEVIFINSSVMNAEEIVDDLPENAEIVYLESGENGIQQITDYLADKTDIDTIRIISHGNDGYIVLNGEIIDAEYLAENSDVIAAWKNALSENADIMLYGCNVAASVDGEGFVDQLATLTGADVAAATFNTGGTEANWELDYSYGEIEAVQLSIDGYEYYLDNQVVTSAADSGAGSLRQAITDVHDGGEITFQDLDMTITVDTQLEISKSLTITGQGAGHTIIQAAETEGTADHRVLSITSGTVTISTLTVRYGCITNEGGGGINITGGDVTILNAVISNNNIILNADNHYGGGGIQVSGSATLDIQNSSIEYNKSTGNHGWAGGIGFYATGGDLTITNSYISYNESRLYGGAMDIFKAGNVEINNSTIAYNTTLGNGGGISNDNSNGLILKNCTIAYNNAVDGGGIWNNATALEVNNCTIAYNTTTGSGAGIMQKSIEPTVVRNSIMAGNTNNGAYDDFYLDSSSTITDGGYNIVGKSTNYTWSGTGDITGNDSGIVINLNLDTELKNNGGPTDTLALLPGSVAIGTIPADSSWNSSTVYDQRGYYRVSGEPTCIGAYITNFIAPYYRTVTGASGYWTNPLLWEISPDNITWFDANTYPTYTDNTITVRSDANVVFDSAIAIDQTIIENGGILVVGSGYTMTINDDTGTDLDNSGTITVNGDINNTGDIINSGTITVNGDINNTGDIINSDVITVFGNYFHAGTLSGTALAYSGDTSTLIYSGSSEQTTSALEFSSSNGPANLIIANTAGVNLNFSRILSGDFTVGEGYSFTTEENTITVGGAADIAGTITISASGVLDVDDSLILSGTVNNSGTIYAASDVTFTGISSIGGTFVYNGSIAQNLANVTYNNLTINKTNNTDTVTLSSGTADVNGNLTITKGILSTVNLDVEGTTSFSGTVGDSTLIITGSGGSNVSFGTLDEQHGTVEYNSDSAQNIVSETYYAVTLAGTGQKNFNGTTTASGGITVSDNMTIDGGSVSTTFVQADESSAESASNRVFTIESDLTVTISNMTVRYGNVTGSGGGISTTGTGTLTLNNITVSDCVASVNGDGVYSDSALTIAGTVDLNSSLYHNTFGNLTFTDSSSILKLAAASNTINESLFFSGNATVEYDGSTDQTVAKLNYYNLTTSGSGTKTLASGTTTVENTLSTGADGFTIGSGNTLQIGSSNDGTGSWVNTAATVTTTGSTVNYGDNQNQTILNTSVNGITYNALVLSGGGTKSFSGTTTAIGGIRSYGGTMTIDGDGASTTIVQAAESAGTATSRVFYIENTVTISNMTIRNGKDENGGGIFNKGVLTLSNCTISGNTATDKGGGIYNCYDSDMQEGATISSILNSTISGNSAGTDGGGIFNNYIISSITNSTISGNTANGKGGGIYAGGSESVTISDCTIAYNHSDYDADPGTETEHGGGIYLAGGTLAVSNTIIANNYIGSGTTGDDYYYGGGSLTDSGYNIVKIQDGDSTGHNKTFDATTDWVWNSSNSRYEKGGSSTTDYGLLYLDTALKANGTLNGTYTLSITSSNSIAAGNGYTALRFDQRGYYRGLIDGVTIGAYEYGGTAPVNGDYISVADGNWSATAVWETYDSSTGEWCAAVAAPDSSDNVIIAFGDTVTVDDAKEATELTVAYGGELTVGTESITVTENITIAGTLTISSGTVTLGGDWNSSAGTFTAGNSTVIFNGSSMQSITSGNNSFYNVIVNNDSIGVKIFDNTTISNNLVLTDGAGLFDTNSNTLTVNGSIQDDSDGNNFDSDHMIIVNGTGKLHLPVAPNTSYLFPVGTYSEDKGYNYSPVTIEFTEGDFSGDDYVEVTAAPDKFAENPCEINYLSRYWNATSSGVVNYEATVTCYYDENDVVGTESGIYGAEYLNGSWIKQTAVDANNHNFTLTAVTSLAVFTGIAAPYTASVVLTPSTPQTITAGNTIHFSASAYDQYGNLITDTATDFTWTNTTDTGLFNSTAAGLYTVNAAYTSVSSGNVTVTVEPGAVNTVSISPSASQTLTSGETVQFSASAYDLYENLITDTATNFTWTNTTSAGLFNTTAPGIYPVIALYGNVSSTAVSVTVNAKPNPTRPDINNGEMINDGTQTQTHTSWRTSIDSDIGTEDNYYFEVENDDLFNDVFTKTTAALSSLSNGEYGLTNTGASSESSGISIGGTGLGNAYDGEYGIDANAGNMVNGEYEVGNSSGIERGFDSGYGGKADLTFNFENDNGLINYEAIAAYNDRHPLFKTELDLLLEKI